MTRVQIIFYNIALFFIVAGANSFAGEIILNVDSTTVPTASNEVINIADSVIIENITPSISIESIDSIGNKAKDELNSIEIKTFKPSPKKAVLYSALFPGLGQIYNKKYWKLPILYGGFVGVSYAITWNNSHYQDYFNAYKDILDDNPETNSWHNLVPYGRDPESIDKNWFTGVLKDRKNYFRYYRDLSIIIGVALYGLGIVDAYVDAQLFEFDVSPDLSLKIEPVMMQKNSNTNFLADSFGFKCSFSF